MSKRTFQIVGLLLWRGGTLFVGAAVLFEIARRVVRFIDIPRQLEIGLGLGLAGLALVIVSLIMERIRDQRKEGDLRD
jgi:hypothetical protein